MEWLDVGGILFVGSPDCDGVDKVWIDEGVVELAEGLLWECFADVAEGVDGWL